MQDFHFANPEYTLLILLLPLLRFVFARANKSARTKLSRFISEQNLSQLLRSRSTFQGRSKIAFFWVGLVCVIFALARPQANPSVEEMQSAGLDIYVLLDVSRSMDAEDVPPSRLKKAKRTIQTLASRLSGDRIGIIAYANSAVLISPLTSDFSILESYLQSVDTSLIPSQGTNVANALEVAKEAMERGAKTSGEDSPRSNIFLVLSDGEDYGESDFSVADEIRKAGGLIFTIAFGTEKGVPIPVRDDRGELRGYKKDQAGEPVLTAVKPGPLQDLANRGGGHFYFTTTGETEVEDLLARVGDAQRGSFTSVRVVIYEELFWLFLLPGLLAILFSFIPLSLLIGRELFLKILKRNTATTATLILLFAFSATAHAGPISFFWSKERKASRQSQELAEQKKFSEAADALKGLQAENPDSPELNYNIGTYLLQDQKGRIGREQLSHLRNADGPLRDYASYNMAGSLAMEGKKDEARAAYAELIQRLAGKTQLTEQESVLLQQAKRNVARLADPNQQQPPQKDKSDQQQQGGGGQSDPNENKDQNKDEKKENQQGGQGKDQKDSKDKENEQGKDKEKDQNKDQGKDKEDKPGDKGDQKDEKKKEDGDQGQDDKSKQQKEGSQDKQAPPPKFGNQPFKERDNMGEDDAKRILGGLKERESNLQKKFLKNQIKGGRVKADDAAKDW